MITIEKAERLQKLPPYLFAELDRKKAEAKAKGVDVIDLGVGDHCISSSFCNGVFNMNYKVSQ